MPQTLQKKCLPTPVLNVYVVRSSPPCFNGKGDLARMRWRNPPLPHIEQLHSVAAISAGAITSNRTRPQWHPPLCLTRRIVSDTGWPVVAHARREKLRYHANKLYESRCAR